MWRTVMRTVASRGAWRVAAATDRANVRTGSFAWLSTRPTSAVCPAGSLRPAYSARRAVFEASNVSFASAAFSRSVLPGAWTMTSRCSFAVSSASRRSFAIVSVAPDRSTPAALMPGAIVSPGRGAWAPAGAATTAAATSARTTARRERTGAMRGRRLAGEQRGSGNFTIMRCVDIPRFPSELLGRLRADPLRAPETIALVAGEVHGPAAAAWARDLRSRYEMSDRDLAKRAKARHAALARFGGAATGLGGFITYIPDLVSLLWIQSRLVFYVAAAYGHDPCAPARPAELLVLRDLYPDVEDAEAALAGTGRRLAYATLDKSLRGSRDAELFGSLLRFSGKRAARHMLAKGIPGFAILFNSWTNERDTRQLAKRAMELYASVPTVR